MIKDFVEIGETVNLPRHKMIGKVVDKIYGKNDVEPLRIVVDIDYTMSRNIYGGINIPDKISVTYDGIKSMKSINMYNNINLPLDIPNLLQRKDVKKGSIVRIVDNYLLEKMLTYKSDEMMYGQLSLKDMINIKGTLTGGTYSLGDWYRPKETVEVVLENGKRYYMYIDCIQLVKRINIFMKIKKSLHKYWEKLKYALSCIFDF